MPEPTEELKTAVQSAGEVLTVAADYVLSAYWVTDPAWQGDRLDTAMRLLCLPRVLVGIRPSAITR